MVTNAKSPLSARDILENNRFDIIITDFELEDGNALDLIKEVKSLGLSTPIIAVSSSMNDSLSKKLLSAGATTTLPKPLNSENLRASILQILANGLSPHGHTGCETAKCFIWQRGKLFYLYNPDTNTLITGETIDIAKERMTASLEEFRGSFGQVSNEGILRVSL